jgi:glycosyltransferase involved in cell wall biosynthesis
MHVVQISRNTLPYPFSAYRLDYPMLQVWAKHMTQLDVIIQSQDQTPRLWQEENLQVHYAPGGHRICRSGRFLWWTMRRLHWIHQHTPIDIISGSDLLGSMAGLLLKPLIRGKVIAQLQGQFLPPSRFLYPPLRRMVMHAVTKYICRHADVVRCLYQAAAADVMALGVSPSRIVTIPSRCDTSLFNPDRFPPRDKSGSRLLYVGNLVLGKGLQFLLVALSDIVRCFSATRLTIVGSGPQQAELEAMVHARKLEDHVEFLGRIPHDQVPQLMHKADLFVFPSLSEATPRVVMEAMAMALPVVATRVGGIPEMVEDGVTGRLVQPGSAPELADAIMWVFRHPAWIKTVERRARQHVVHHYTLERHIEQMLALFQRAFREGKG